METLFFVVTVFAVIGGVVWLGIREHRLAVANLAAAAVRLGLNHVVVKKTLGFDEQHAEGVWSGRPVRIWTYTTGSGKSRQQWVTAGVLTPRGGDVRFTLRGQGMLTKISQFFGTKEVTVGERNFDDEWFVTSNVPEEFAAALLPEIQEKLMAVRRAGLKGTFQRDEGWVRYVESGSFAKARAVAHLEAALPVLVDLADVAEVCAERRG